MAVNPIPAGYHTITPYFVIEGASRFIDFLKKAFNAQEIHSFKEPNGTIKHAELNIGSSPIMVAEANEASKPMPSTFYLYVKDTDATYHQALQAGAISIIKPTDQFYGDRNAGVADPFGNQWWIATRIENVSPEEMEKRAKAFYTKK